MRRILSVVSLLLMVSGTAAAQNAYGPGRVDLDFVAGQHYSAGTVTIHNNNGGLMIEVQLENGWKMIELHVHAGWEENPVPMKSGNPTPGKFDFKYEYEEPASSQKNFLDFEEDLEGFRWGQPYEPMRLRHIAVHADVVQLNPDGTYAVEEGAWAKGDLEFEGGEWGWWLKYPMAHKNNVHFIDSPVAGLQLVSPTENVFTNESGAALYFPGEYGRYYLGNQLLGECLLDHKVSPLDFFPVSEIETPEVTNMAVLLQSLDADGSPKQGINFTPEVRECFNDALDAEGYITDWADATHIDVLLDTTFENCGGVADLNLVKVSAEDAQGNLDRSLNSNMFRKNVSRTPEDVSSKAKLNVMGVWFPAKKANGDPAPVDYFDEEGEWIRTADQAKPLVVSYTDAAANGAHDVWAAVSRDDGHTWKKKNLSRMAERSSFTRFDGYEFPGECKKPVLQVKGNKILVAWTSKYARGGKPGYAIDVCPADDPGCIVCSGYEENEVCEPDYTYDDPYYQDDIWGVSGPQRSHDYTEDGYPEVGEVPYSAVWVARGAIVTQSMIDSSSFWANYVVGDIVWFKPERLTSGRRDAYQVFMGGADEAGFAIAWQEDPEGLRPGNGCGPGHGWGGATTNHKTDIWYSHIGWEDFDIVDTHFVSGGDPQHEDPDFIGRPKALVPMSLPLRISDNDVVNTHNMWIQLDAEGLPLPDADGNVIPIPNPDTNSDDSDGSHRYGYMVEGLWDWDGQLFYEDQPVNWQRGNGGTLYRFTNHQGDQKTAVVTADGRALRGNTGASRPNLFLQAYTKADGTKSAWAILAYEETKGVGQGPDGQTGEEDGDHLEDGSGWDPNRSAPDEGKNVIYHSFDFRSPDVVSAGTIMNLPETDAGGTPLYAVEPDCLGSLKDEDGNFIFDADENHICNPNPVAGQVLTNWKGDPISAYENARRPRFILQSKTSAFGGFTPDGVTYKEPYNSGTVAILLYKEGEEGKGRPSDIMARRCVVKDANGNIKKGNPWSPENFLPGVQNVSTQTPLETWVNPDRDPKAKGDGVKVCKWEQTSENLSQKSGANPYEDARAHRGQIRGDFVIMGYSYTPNWAASKKAHDKYDFYIRRSFNGGANWGTDPAASVGVVHRNIFIDPYGVSGAELDELGNDATEATKHYYVETSYEPGVFEPARNVSLIKNNKTSVIEPRIVAVPGTIKLSGNWTGEEEDKQNRNVFYMAYGTETNIPDAEKSPEDLFYTFSTDRGTTLFEEEWIVNPDSDGNHAGETRTGWGRLAKSDAQEGEVQLRMTPDGSRFYSSWLEEGHGGNDIIFRRLTPKEFAGNNAGPQ